MGGRYLVISDLQIPFQAPDSLKFCKAVQRDFRIPPANVLCVGDELDQYWGGLWDKDPDALHTPNSELYESRRVLHAWYRAFPEMRLAVSNHGLRWAKKAFKAGIPSQMLRSYQELIGAPKGWRWQHQWLVKERRPFLLIHGMGYGGMNAFRQAPLDQGVSTVFGHLHANAGIAHIVTGNQALWGMNVGCLIDVEAYAFNYGKDSRFKPWRGVGVVVDGGLTPILVPYERF